MTSCRCGVPLAAPIAADCRDCVRRVTAFTVWANGVAVQVHLAAVAAAALEDDDEAGS